MVALSACSDPAADGFFAPDIALLARNWGWVLLRGVLALLLATVAFLFPVDAVFGFALVVAAFAGADGAISLAAGVRGAVRREQRWGALEMRGILGIAIALLLVLMPGFSDFSYALVTASLFAAWAILAGILEILVAARLRKSIADEWMFGTSGVLLVILGLVVSLMLWAVPITSLISVDWLIAGWALLSGFALIALALQLKHLRRSVRAGTD